MEKLLSIFIYPIKSVAGVQLQEAYAGERGFQYDRRWMLIDRENNFITQRRYHELALVGLALKDESMVLSHKVNGKAAVEVPMKAQEGDSVNAVVWDDKVELLWPKLPADEWFSDLLQIKVRLVYMPDETHRQIDPKYVSEKMSTSLSDAYPYLLVNQSSIVDVAKKAGMHLEVARFRPSILIDSSKAFEEDRWRKIQIGEVVFRIVRPCARCVLTTIDPQTGTTGKEPLQTLSTYRKVENKILFGQNMIAESYGIVRIGDEIRIIQ